MDQWPSCPRDLRLAADTVSRTDHAIAWMGDLGVGKTTALCLVTDLRFTSPDGRPRYVFPTGSGRTTVCEVAVRVAPAFGISVELETEKQVRERVSDLVSEMVRPSAASVPSEIDRVIRGMSGLARIKLPSQDGKAGFRDPLRDLVLSTAGAKDPSDTDIDSATDAVLARMELSRRIETQLVLPEGSDEEGMRWLAANATRINNGQHPDIGVPRRITVLMPAETLRDTSYALTVVDTKGVEGTTQRPDLKARIDDPRTLVVLCCRFNDAPGTTARAILEGIVEGGSDAADEGRVVILVLPRPPEATEILDDTGARPETVREGYDIREDQIRTALGGNGLRQLPILFLDPENDDPREVWRSLCSQVDSMRRRAGRRIEALAAAAKELVTDCDVQKSRQARIAISDEFILAVGRMPLAPTVVAAHQNLVDEILKGHQRSIAAAMDRDGEWDNFPVLHILGVGVRFDANRRTRNLLIKLDGQTESLLDRFGHLPDARQTLSSLREDLKIWRRQFLARAEHVGKSAFRGSLGKGNQPLGTLPEPVSSGQWIPGRCCGNRPNLVRDEYRNRGCEDCHRG